MGVTRTDNYFEDFQVGDTYIHGRGRTVTEMDNVMFTHLAMNTAEPHFNEDMMANLPSLNKFGSTRVVVGTFSISLIMGLAAEDCCENALAELGLDKMRLPSPVFHGDTIYAESEVIGKEENGDNPHAGIVHFRVIGRNQNDERVFEGERKVLIKKREYYLNEDQKFGPEASF